MSGHTGSPTVRIRFDPTARRWWISDGSTELGAELVIDAVIPGRGELDDVRAAFGAQVAATVERLASTGAHEVIDHSADVTAPAALLAVEPGVLVGAGPGTWVADTGNGTARITVGPAALHIIVTGAVGATLWARVSAGRTGVLLAVGPLVPTAEPGTLVSTLAFGLDLDPSEMVITVTEHPMAPIGDRWQRAEQRFDALMRDAMALARRRPRRAAVLAERAMALADVLGDPTRAAMATDLARTWRRRWLMRWIAGGAVAAVAVITAFVARDDGSVADGSAADGSATVGSTTTLTEGATVSTSDAPMTPASTTFPWTAADGDPGPTTVTFADGSGAMVMIDGAEPIARPGGQWSIALRITSREVGVFDETGDLDRAAERCRLGTPTAITAGALVPGSLTLRLTRTDGDGGTGGSIVLGQVPFNPQTDPILAVPDTCGELVVIDGRVLAEHSVIRAGQTAIFDLDPDLTPGLWDLAIDNSGKAVESVVGTIRLVVTPDD